MTIIGITGTLGAGKGTVVDYLVVKGFAHYSARDFITREIERRELPVNRDTMTIVANDLRATHSPSYIAETLYDEAAAAGKNAVIESLRTEGEIAALRAKGNFLLIAVDADPKIRYERIIARGSETDKISLKNFSPTRRAKCMRPIPISRISRDASNWPIIGLRMTERKKCFSRRSI